MGVMERLFKLIVRLGKAGLIHGDFNEFNLMINEKEEITLIDFPQIVMMDHANADYYFMRDVNCIKAFFRKRFSIECEQWPTYKEVMEEKKKELGENTDSDEKVTDIGGLLERRDDDLLLNAIQEERDCDLEEESENEDDNEEDSDEDEESDEEEEQNDEDDMNALINQMMERRRMEEDDLDELEKEMDELNVDSDDENNDKEKSSSSKFGEKSREDDDE